MTCKPPAGCRNSVDTVADCRSSQTSGAGHFDRPQATNWNVTLPPDTTGTGAATPPENTSCPARKPSSSAASW
jgi:hypothetical protein